MGFGKNTFVNQTDFNPYKNEGSNYVKDLMEEEIIEFLNSEFDETLTLIRNNTYNVSRISKCLLEKQTIYLDNIERVIDKNKINID